MKLDGRILFLYEDPELVARQLAGEDVPFEGQDLHFGVNTDDMISGGACTKGYTSDVLGPYFLQGFQGAVGHDAVRTGGFQVIVGGHAYGSGSSREVAVVAHQGAGIKIVVARSFERIFLENMRDSGVMFTTDFGILERLRDGEDIDPQGLFSSLPTFFRLVAEAGGLLPLGSDLLDGRFEPWYEIDRAGRPMTVVEKIIAEHVWTGGDNFGLTSVHPGEQLLCRVDQRGMHEYTTGMCMHLFKKGFGVLSIHAPASVTCFQDHFVLLDHPDTPLVVRDSRLIPARRLAAEMVAVCEQNGIRLHGPGRELPAGICHRLMVERYARPGDIVVLTDSHSPTSGVLNCFAFGIGSTAMSFALGTGLVPVTVPKTVRVVLTGYPHGALSAKDLILHLIGDQYFRDKKWQKDPADTCVIQFGGQGLDHWSVDELSVLTNMTVEAGLMAGILEPIQRLMEFLRRYRGDSMAGRMVYPDDGAVYERTIVVDLAKVPLTVATPGSDGKSGDARNRALLADCSGIEISNVFIGSCTGGSIVDLREASDVLRGRTINKGVRVTVTPSSAEVAELAEQEGIFAHFRDLGAVITEPGCGACIGNGPGGPRDSKATVSTTNRNFAGRMGTPGPIYLASAAVAAASAVTGYLTDPQLLP